ncbi:MAG: ferredoxin family protein [Halobacteriaceae archaeon]
MSAEPSVPDVENASIEDRLYTITYTDAGESHLGVVDPDVCDDVCETYECITVCPADVWNVDDGGVPTIAYENCLECGSCRFACPYDNVVWEYPETGAGVTYSHG